MTGDQIVGVAIIFRPAARHYNGQQIAEVARLVTDGTPHVGSMLYAAAARACQAMGYRSIQTYVLDYEPGTSLRAADGFSPTWCRTPTGVSEVSAEYFRLSTSVSSRARCRADRSETIGDQVTSRAREGA